MKRVIVAFSVVFIVLLFAQSSSSVKHNADLIIKISDFKEFKKYLRTHTNVIVVFSKTAKDFTTYDIFNEVAIEAKGIASIVHIDCWIDKKLCKKMKVSPATVQYKHFKDGEFHKNYDRKLVTKSIVKFLQNPTGEIPWNEEPTAVDVVHVEKNADLFKVITKEKKPLLVMFYAPWCGFCTKLKPDFAAAATTLKGKAVLLGMDVDTVEGGPVRSEFNITGFPTIIYFKNGKKEMNYGGENTKEGIVEWMNNPQPPKPVEAEQDWSDVESEVVHLTDSTFEDVIEKSSSALVMFYAPWCGHCKKMKPEYEEAASIMKEQNIPGILAAVDATKYPQLATKFSIKGYPSVKYFKDGKELFDNNDRTKESIVAFMKDPKEPPPPPPADLPWSDTESFVEHLDKETFKNFIKKKKHSLVIFYAPWCGHCKKAKPEFMEAAEVFKDDAKVAFAAVDCTKSSQLCQSSDVTGYPTFKYFNYGSNEQKYSGGREKNDFINFMKDPTGSKPHQAGHWDDIPGNEVVTILKGDNFDDFIQKHHTVLVTFYGASCSHCQTMRKDFVEAAIELKQVKNDVRFAAVDVIAEESIRLKHGIVGLPTIKLYSQGKPHLEYEGERAKENFINLVNNPPPLVVPFTDFESKNILYLNSVDQIDELLKTMTRVFIFFYEASNPKSVDTRPAFWEAAENVSDKNSQFAVVDCSASHDLCKKYSVKSYPVFKLFVNGKLDSNVDLMSPVTKDSLIAFLSKEVHEESLKIEL